MRDRRPDRQARTDPPPLMTAKAAAAYLAIGERTLWSLSNRGEIASVRIGRAVRYDPSDLAAFIARQKTNLHQ